MQMALSRKSLWCNKNCRAQAGFLLVCTAFSFYFFGFSPSANARPCTPKHLYFDAQGYQSVEQDSLPDTLAQVLVYQAFPQKFVPLPHQVLTQAALLRDDGVSVTPALNRVAGVYMHAGTLSTNRVVIRGIGSRSTFSTNKLRAYLDDIPLTAGDGETTIEDIDLSLLSEVRVFKGPTASYYGAGLGGLIKMQLAAPPFTNHENRWIGSINTHTTLGSFGLLRNATTLTLANKRLTTAVNFNSTRTDGWRENNRYNRSGWSGFARYQWKKAGKTTVFVQLKNKLNAQIPSSLNLTDFRERPQMANPGWVNAQGREVTEKQTFAVGHQVNLHSFERLRLRSSSSVFVKTRGSNERRPFNVLQESSTISGLRTELSLVQKGLENMPFSLVSVGLEHYSEGYDWATLGTLPMGAVGAQLTDNTEKRKVTNLFAQTYYAPVQKLRFLLGANLNTTNYTSDNTSFGGGIFMRKGAYSFDPILSPHLGITYDAHPQWQFFGTWSHGFSAPTVQETLTPEGAFNPDIQPETGENREIGLRLKRGYLRGEVSIYDLAVRNLLVADRIGPDQYVGVNAGKTSHRGLEIDLQGNANAFLSGFLTYTFAHYRFIDFENRGQDFSGNKLPGVAPHHLQTGIDLRYRGAFANLSSQWLSAYPITDGNTLQSEAYHLAHAQLGYLWSYKTFSLEARTGVQNLFDRDYASMILINATAPGTAQPRYYYPGAPRNWYASLKLRLEI
jgi:iron complex outermembrane recepter protein